MLITKNKVENKSDIQYIKTGIPQGSLIEPILFVIYLNDIIVTKKSENNIINYVDDTTLLVSSYYFPDLQQEVLW